MASILIYIYITDAKQYYAVNIWMVITDFNHFLTPKCLPIKCYIMNTEIHVNFLITPYSEKKNVRL